MKEIVKPIEGFDGYFISNLGKVYSNLGKGRRDRRTRVDLYEISPRPTKKGYLRVCMRNLENNKRVDKYIHRLVASHFIENPYDKKVVNHIDCDKSNNHITNLEWVTTLENIRHAMTIGSLGRDKETGRFIKKQS